MTNGRGYNKTHALAICVSEILTVKYLIHKSFHAFKYPLYDIMHILYMLICTRSYKQVLCVGPTGTGKTLTVSDKLLKTMPSKYMSDILSFSARTSANQTQVRETLVANEIIHPQCILYM